jgi:hypothetical protein
MENSGADYLRRLKRDQEQQPQTYVEPAPAPAPADSDPQERRRNPRYKCEGSATFRVEGTNVRTWGTFTDLSCSGCYVELKATFPAGAIIDLELELNGVRAQVKGEVRVSYPFLGMGVAFRDLTTENRMQIQAMIESILPAALKRSVVAEPETAVHPASMPIILNRPRPCRRWPISLTVTRSYRKTNSSACCARARGFEGWLLALGFGLSGLNLPTAAACFP